MAEKKTGSKKTTTTKKNVEKKTQTVEKKNNTKKVETKTEVKTPVVETKKVEKVEVKTESGFGAFIKTNARNLILGLICVLLIINIVIISIGHQVKLTDGKEVVASIDGKKYTAEELFEELKKQYGSNALINLIDQYISDKELNEDDMKKAKEQASEYVASIKEQYESAGYEWETVLSQYGYANEDALVDEYLLSVKAELVARNEIEKSIKEEDINTYYEKNVYGNYTVKHILITPDTTNEMTDEQKTAAEEAAKATANEVISKYAAGESWATLVSTYSEDEGSKDNEGLVENFTYGEMVDEFFNASVALKDGEYTKEPVKSSYGYHVILRVSATEKPALKDKLDDIKTALVDSKLNEDSKLLSTTWVNIRKKYNLSIEDTTIKNAYEKTISE